MEHNSKELKHLIREKVIGSLDFYRDISDAEMLELIDREMAQLLRYSTCSIKQKKALRTEIFDSIRKLDVLQQLLDDPTITDVRTPKTIQCNNV